VSEDLLTAERISKRFGKTQALEDVSFTTRSGEVLALVGENGAGKSTLMKVLSGAVAPDAGTLQLASANYAPRGPGDALAAGVAMIYQELTLAPDLSVEDNILLGQAPSRFGWLNRKAGRQRAREALALLGHADLALNIPVGRLSLGTQQIVEIARAIVRQARLIIFDEPTSSLARNDAERLFEVIRILKDRGLGIIYISHFLEEVRAVCDTFCVLRDGRVAGSGRVADVSDQQIIAQMAGRSVEQLFPHVPHTPGEVILKIDSLSGTKKPKGVSLELRRGEIFGLAGLVGAGRTELARCLMALNRSTSGIVQVDGKTIAEDCRLRLRSGLGFCSEDRKGESLAQSMSIEDNVTLSRLRPYRRWGFLNGKSRRRGTREATERLQVKCASVEQAVSQLSGGNQQKVVLARLLHEDADVWVLDEPTRGIDVGTKSDIYRLMGELAARGKAILFISSYLPELLAVCDRVGIMARGHLLEVRAASDWTEHDALARAIETVDP
jgi:ribose transport system ATP-binding protein